MACASGYEARLAVSERASAEILSQRVNEGLATGFGFGAPAAAIAFIIVI